MEGLPRSIGVDLKEAKLGPVILSADLREADRFSLIADPDGDAVDEPE